MLFQKNIPRKIETKHFVLAGVALGFTNVAFGDFFLLSGSKKRLLAIILAITFTLSKII